MSEPIYPLTEREYNSIVGAVTTSITNLIACQNLLDLPILAGSFERTSEGVLEDGAEAWITAHYATVTAVFLAVTELVNNARDELEMRANTSGMENFFDNRRCKK